MATYVESLSVKGVTIEQVREIIANLTLPEHTVVTAEETPEWTWPIAIDVYIAGYPEQQAISEDAMARTLRILEANFDEYTYDGSDINDELIGINPDDTYND
jgi:hypothetical protein